MYRLWILLTLLMLIVVACGGDNSNTPESQSQPTLAVDEDTTDSQQSDAPTRTPLPTQVPQATAPPVVTLPPTWTPQPTNTAIQATLTPTEGPTSAPIRTLQACDGFGPDFANSDTEFVLGESPTISWTSVEGAELYRILIFDELQVEVLRDFTEETSRSINPDVFYIAGRYGWQIEPLDAIGVQICPGRGEALRVTEAG